ncbi:EexN family lipoprotein [Bosea vaviloviae]|uniref:EexN family lipoprotein n=1 Tax=Bosea vaviloviae TaxID=1526658 RepID=A0A0N1F3F7_9HYPH|nr:EexN family lipoprotein [Bosea vaviloviae]KPH79456.1 hypothetical protein AE618_18505 [Bosea vaviloviae]
MMKPLAAVLMTMAFSGCGDETAQDVKPPPIRDVPFFLANASDHDFELARCRANPGELMSDAACRNAEEANRKVMIWGREAALKRASN